jgi:hypothetical protein
MTEIVDAQGDERAYRAAQRIGLVVRRSRAELSPDNYGGYRLVDLDHNRIVAGEKFDLTADDVEKICQDLAEVT